MMKKIKLLIVSILLLTGFSIQAQDAYEQSKIYFDITIPREFSVLPVYGEDSNTLDYSDYVIQFNGHEDVITTYSIGLGRVGCGSEPQCYEGQLSEWEKTIDITYKIKKDNWFVISGIGKYSGRIFYLKGSFGDRYMSTLRFSYPPEDKKEVEKYLPLLSKSFQSK